MRSLLREFAAIVSATAPFPALVAQPTEVDARPATMTFSDIAVDIVNLPDGAAPPSAQRDAPVSDGSALTLAYLRGEAIDADFVIRQFAHNGMIGRPVEVARAIDLVQIINADLLSQGFVNSGLLLDSTTPPADGAPLRLRLVFGRLAERDGPVAGITVEWGVAGRRGLEEDYILSRMPSATAIPLNAGDIERDFRLLSDDPLIRSVRADLRPTGVVGEAQLALSVDVAPPYDLTLTIANNRTPSVGGVRAAIGGRVGSVLIGSDQLTFEFGRTRGVSDIAAGYSAPLFSSLRFSIRGGLNDAAVIDPALLALDITARDRFAEAGLVYSAFRRPLTPAATPGEWISSRTLNFGILTLHRQTRTSLFGQPFSFTPGSVRGRAEYTALRASGDFVDRGPKQVVTATITTTLGLGGTRSDVPGLPQPPRNFAVALGQFNYARLLSDNRLEVLARLTAQWTNNILYTAERFSLGGSNTVRGYRENLVLADRGVLGSIELVQPFTIGARSGIGHRDALGSFTGSIFLDAGWSDNIGSVDAVPRWVASTGVSLLWTPSHLLSARVTYGVPLRQSEVVGRRDLQDRGIHFMVTVRPLQLLE